MFFLEMLVFISLLALAGTYLIYPLFFYLVNQIIKNGSQIATDNLPAVALIVSLSNENEMTLQRALDNRLQLDYPRDKLTLVFAADGSSEAGREVLKENKAGIRLFEFTERQGKTGVLNSVIPALNSEVLVFSDVNSLYHQSALKKLVRHFSNPGIGGVCGELRYVDTDIPDVTGKVSNVYLKYEKLVKASESKVSTLTIFNGAIYAIRRHLHQEMNPQAANDFQHPIQIVLQGYKSVYEPEAVAYEQAVKNDSVEFQRTVRITARGWKGMFTYLSLLNPFKTGLFSLQFVFRKLLRWLGPILMIALFVSSYFLKEQLLYLIIFWAQASFYLLALAGWLLRNQSLNKVVYYPYYFCLVNIAALKGLVIALSGKDTAKWVPSEVMASKADDKRSGW